jgi:hypothetical protein
MPLLEDVQANFIATINNGPAVLNENLFTGPLDRVLLGLKAHANTISHARLVALEETFPLTRAHLGDAKFNSVSREYAETNAARARDNNAIGRDFAAFLAVGGNDPAVVELARIEWAWLEAYHAADAKALRLNDIATLAETTLLALHVQWHPATRLVATTVPLAPQLNELAAINGTPAAVLLTRPDTDVALLPLVEATASLAAACQKRTTIGNLLDLAAEQNNEADPSGQLVTLIGAGALVALE